MPSLESLHFTNRFTRDLPGDPERENRRRQVRQACWSGVNPTPVSAPRLVAYAREVAELLDIEVTPDNELIFAHVFGGNRMLPGMEPFAMCYGGHQFGNWAGQLGDGRAINLGNCRMQLGRAAEAEAAYRRATVLAPANPDAWFGLGYARFHRKDLEAALKALDNALGLDARHSNSLKLREQILR